MVNLTDLQKVEAGLSQYVVRPANAFGLGGFVFDIPGRIRLNLASAITDHYVEDNTAIQDHWANRPRRVTLTSYVGYKTGQNQAQNNLSEVQKVTQRLTDVTAYAPPLIDSALAVRNSLKSSDNIVQTENEVVNLWALTQNLNPTADPMQKAWLYFNALWSQKILVGLQTPYEFIPNMAIENLLAEQPDDTNSITNFSITLKEIRTASVETVQYTASKYQGHAALQQSPTVNKGKVQGQASSLFEDTKTNVFKYLGL